MVRKRHGWNSEIKKNLRSSASNQMTLGGRSSATISIFSSEESTYRSVHICVCISCQKALFLEQILMTIEAFLSTNVTHVFYIIMYLTLYIVTTIRMKWFLLSRALRWLLVHCNALKCCVKCEFVRKHNSGELCSDLIWTFTLPGRRGEDEDWWNGKGLHKWIQIHLNVQCLLV